MTKQSEINSGKRRNRIPPEAPLLGCHTHPTGGSAAWLPHGSHRRLLTTAAAWLPPAAARGWSQQRSTDSLHPPRFEPAGNSEIRLNIDDLRKDRMLHRDMVTRMKAKAAKMDEARDTDRSP